LTSLLLVKQNLLVSRCRSSGAKLGLFFCYQDFTPLEFVLIVWKLRGEYLAN